MQELARQANAFSLKNLEDVSDAQQRVALQILCGINFDEALAASGEQYAAVVQRLERALKVERLKGLKRHWSYDLNRHIALKQARDRLRQTALKSKSAA
ncbi:MAG: cytoplasmic protein [Mesorhizobium sp.]